MPNRTSIYYTGIGAGRRQFFTERTFWRMIQLSPDLQIIISHHDPQHRPAKDMSIEEICEIIGADIL